MALAVRTQSGALEAHLDRIPEPDQTADLAAVLQAPAATQVKVLALAVVDSQITAGQKPVQTIQRISSAPKQEERLAIGAFEHLFTWGLLLSKKVRKRLDMDKAECAKHNKIIVEYRAARE